MHVIAANDLKKRGVSVFEDNLQDAPEAIITVRGQERYVVMRMEQYHYLREMELEAALMEVRRDIANGDVIRESPEAHINRISEA